jgi:hypothetical protein
VSCRGLAAWVTAMALPVLVAVGDAYAGTVAEARVVATERLTAAEDCDQGAAGGHDGTGPRWPTRCPLSSVATRTGGPPRRSRPP